MTTENRPVLTSDQANNKNAPFFDGIHFLQSTKHWCWRFEGRVIYSFLAHHQESLSERALARSTTLNRQTVRRLLREMREEQLTVQEGRKWIALENDVYFKRHPKGQEWNPWNRRFIGFPLYLPGQLSIRTCGVYALLRSMAGKTTIRNDLSYAYLAALLKLSYPTVKSSIARLVDEGLIGTAEQGRHQFSVLICPVRDEHTKLFRGKQSIQRKGEATARLKKMEKKLLNAEQAKTNEEQAVPPREPKSERPLLDTGIGPDDFNYKRLHPKMAELGMKEQQRREIVTLFIDAHMDTHEAIEMIHKYHRIASKGVTRGDFKTANPYWLLKKDLEPRVARIERNFFRGR